VLQQVAPPTEVYRQPANLFVAGFIGNPPMNTITGRPVNGDGSGELVVETANGRVQLTATHQASVRGSGAAEVVVGVRPERVLIGDTGQLVATVVVVESLGYESHVVCRLADGQSVTVRLPGDAPAPRDGTTVHLSAAVDHLHLFDAATGARIT